MAGHCTPRNRLLRDSRRMVRCLLAFPPRPALPAHFVPLSTVSEAVEDDVDRRRRAPPRLPSGAESRRRRALSRAESVAVVCCTNRGLSLSVWRAQGPVKISPGYLVFQVFPLYSSPVTLPANVISWHLVALHPRVIPSFFVCAQTIHVPGGRSGMQCPLSS